MVGSTNTQCDLKILVPPEKGAPDFGKPPYLVLGRGEMVCAAADSDDVSEGSDDTLNSMV